MMQRRQWLARASGLALGAMAVPIPSLAQAQPGQSLLLRSSRALMGTQLDLSVAALPEALARRAMDAAWQRMAALAAMMSRYEAGNPLDTLAQKAGRPGSIPLPAELTPVLAQALQRARDTQGLFDPTVGSYQGWDFRPGREHQPDAQQLRAEQALHGWRHLELSSQAHQARLTQAGVRLDLGGVAKLPILQAGLDVLREHGARHALINGGGDILSLGQAAPDRPWRVALRDPRAPQRWLGTLDLPATGAVLAASGDYERGFVVNGRRLHHILDPRSGEPSQGLHGIALLGHRVEDLNAWGPAMMVAGPAAARRWAQGLQGVELMLAGPGPGQGSEQLWMSAGLRRQMRVTGQG